MSKISRKIAKFSLNILFLFVTFIAVSPFGNILAQAKLVTPPQNFTIDLINEKDVILLWEDASSGVVQEYIIYRGLDPSKPLKELARIPATESTYEDSTVEVGQTYAYRVSAVSKGYSNGDSEILTVQVRAVVQENDTQATPASAPTSSGIVGTLLNNENFWPNLIGINLLLGGILVLSYILLRGRLDSVFKATRAESTSQNGNFNSPQVNINYDTKKGSPDVRIREEAFERYFKERKEKLRGWEEMAKD